MLFSDSIAQPALGRCRFERVWDFPTSILQRKNSRCIYVCPACGYNVIDETKIVSSKTVIWLCRFPKNSNIEVLTGAKRFIFLTPYSLASFCERFQVSDLIHIENWELTFREYPDLLTGPENWKQIEKYSDNLQRYLDFIRMKRQKMLESQRQGG